MNETLAIDFDGVIHDKDHPLVGRRMGGPIADAKEALIRLKQLGYKIIVFSVWADKPKVIADWMNYYKIPFDEITNIKPQAKYYIDDKAVRFINWPDTLKFINDPK